jgi:flagellar biosynthesis/type III secretory pathway protein FliH
MVCINMTDSFLDKNPPFQAYLTEPMSISDVDNHPDSFRIWSTINHVQAEAIKFGYEDGYKEAYDKSYEDDWNEGYDKGYEDGCNEGYDKAIKDSTK